MAVKPFFSSLSLFIYVLFFVFSAFAAAKNNSEVPTSPVTGTIPIISDHEMAQCVKLYRRSEEIFQELLAMKIDINDQKSLRNVNNKIEVHERMVQQFNQNCAGKQSLSACMATKRSLSEKGLVYQDCKITNSAPKY